MSAKPDQGIQVIGKAARLLDALAESAELNANDLAATLGEPRSSVYRLLDSLQVCGLVEPASRRGFYRLGLQLFSLGAAVAARFSDISAAALPVMEGLHDETEQTVFLSVRRGYDALCVERLDGRVVQVLILRRGGTLPLHAASGGRVLLAFQPRSFWSEYLTHRAEAALDEFPIDADLLTDRLEAITADGLAISDEDVLPGIAAIGAPIFDHSATVVAALSLSGLRASLLGDDREAHCDLVRDGAAEISRSLGHRAAKTAERMPLSTTPLSDH